MATRAQIIEGLQILERTQSDDTVCAEHDIIYAGNVLPTDLTDVELKRLEVLGWYRQDGIGWCHNT